MGLKRNGNNPIFIGCRLLNSMRCFMGKVITITSKTIDNISEVYLHDAEVKVISCNYPEHNIKIPIVLPLPYGGNGLLDFEDVAYSEICFYEPWGKGYYILGISIEGNLVDFKNCDINDADALKVFAKNNSCFKPTIELNSGDRINIVAKKMIYSIVNDIETHIE